MDTHIPQSQLAEDEFVAPVPAPPVAAMGFFKQIRDIRRFSKLVASGRRRRGRDISNLTDEEILAQLIS